MADIRWNTRYRPRSSGVHTRVVADNPAGTWATDQISLFYDLLVAFVEDELTRTRSGVMAKARVDTGFMRAQTEAFITHTRKEITWEFGWFDERPYYARFQEFGTSRGITPMFAVQREWVDSFTRLKHELRR